MCRPWADKQQPPLSFQEAAFFGGHAEALALYRALRGRLLTLEAESEILVQASQISFRAPRPYAWVWRPPGTAPRRRGTLRLTLTFAAPFAVDSPRIAAKTEAYPGRFTHHVRIAGESEIDEELMSWLSLSLRFRNPAKGPHTHEAR